MGPLDDTLSLEEMDEAWKQEEGFALPHSDTFSATGKTRSFKSTVGDVVLIKNLEELLLGKDNGELGSTCCQLSLFTGRCEPGVTRFEEKRGHFFRRIPKAGPGGTHSCRSHWAVGGSGAEPGFCGFLAPAPSTAPTTEVPFTAGLGFLQGDFTAMADQDTGKYPSSPTSPSCPYPGWGDDSPRHCMHCDSRALPR